MLRSPTPLHLNPKLSQTFFYKSPALRDRADLVSCRATCKALCDSACAPLTAALEAPGFVLWSVLCLWGRGLEGIEVFLSDSRTLIQQQPQSLFVTQVLCQFSCCKAGEAFPGSLYHCEEGDKEYEDDCTLESQAKLNIENPQVQHTYF